LSGFVGYALALAFGFFGALGRQLLVGIAGDGGDVRRRAGEGVQAVDAGVGVRYLGDCVGDSGVMSVIRPSVL
jgi:hypothetical protein